MSPQPNLFIVAWLASFKDVCYSIFGAAHCAVVGLDGLEPSTSRLSGARSSHLSYRPVSLRLFSSSIFSQGFTLDGGDEGIRTLDPLLAGQVLSQLSYTPIKKWRVKSEEWKVFASLFSYFGFVSQDSNWILTIEQQNLSVQRVIHIYQVFCPNLTTSAQSLLWLALTVSIERRWSSRTFRYGYLVTT